jgi:colicin import membrane protein
MAMDSTLKRHDSLMPQRPGGTGKGTAMALLVHVGLLIALAFGVSWRSQTPAGVTAELWAAVPQVAAPPAVESKPTPPPQPQPRQQPPPQPQPQPQPTPPVKAEEPPKPAQPDPQIAIEKEKAERKQRELREEQERERREQERLEREKAEKLAAQKQRELEAKRQKEEEQRQAKLREDNMKRMLGQVAGTGAPNSPGTAVREAGPSSSYAGRVVARVKPHIVLTDDIPGNPQADVEVRCAPDGTIVGSRLMRSSGNKVWDDAVLRALERTEVLPRDTDGRVPSPMVISFRPRD